MSTGFSGVRLRTLRPSITMATGENQEARGGEPAVPLGWPFTCSKQLWHRPLHRLGPREAQVGVPPLAWVWGEGDRNPTPSVLSSPPGVPVPSRAQHGKVALKTDIREDRASEPRVGASHREGSCVWARERSGERQAERERERQRKSAIERERDRH